MDEQEKLEKAVDAFAEKMKKRLFQKMDEGFTGWDNLKREYDVAVKMTLKAQDVAQESSDNPHKDLVDIANFAMMLDRDPDAPYLRFGKP